MKKILFLVLVGLFMVNLATAAEKIKVHTWEGYVTPEDIVAVNKLLVDQGYPYEVEILPPYATGPDQMFEMLRNADGSDISFLTLNYIRLQGEKIAKTLQPINVTSPRLTNYQKLNPVLKSIPMGLTEGNPLYIPWGGGAYAFWANMNRLKKEELPTSVKDLLKPRWKGKISLTRGQIHPNIALVMLSMGLDPFRINDLVKAGDRDGAAKLAKGEVLENLKALYSQVHSFWDAAPNFSDEIDLVTSYGIEIAGENAKGGKWEIVNLQEGNTVWLDTICFSSRLTGKKLEAAEIFANYFIGAQVQNRVVKNLSMVAASQLVDANPMIDQNPNFFDARLFWPPYDTIAENLMLGISKEAMPN